MYIINHLLTLGDSNWVVPQIMDVVYIYCVKSETTDMLYHADF